ncbi:monofunctional biosynthetic peptidoglycan transglycosylase [Paracoccus aminophilus]|uniref:Biosynthetic peptidoglycan transglycosylase n=1 Tax=Paracoccus aminophilus JCM 7686 TaxID=1367847 RepID=S5YF36_PARAH|nr:monofunctional biosynthetic peptidoglycan transglycosylase [Paracoccus aminophilus]AGT10058.1 monofunctional biosynthetic peptidoglycan transglycosylase [Paracoccus aminophilus JCM 7686]
MSHHAELLDDNDPQPRDPQPRRPALMLLLRRPMRWLKWFALRCFALMLALVFLFAFVNPPTTWTILTETRAHPGTPHTWTPISEISPNMLRAVVAAEDANFCSHWGFDMQEIRKVVASGSSRGASTLTQQTAKNVYLWQGRSWPRKFLETAYTPMLNFVWSKRRIVEVYLNVAEFGPGVFGIAAAAKYHFKTTPDKLTMRQAAALASILPAPKTRKPDPNSPRSRQIISGAETIAADGRDGCLHLN